MGFGAIEQIRVSLQYADAGALTGTDVPGTAQVIATTDVNGNFAGTFTVMSTVNALIPGTYILAAKGGQTGRIARATFTVASRPGGQLVGTWVNVDPNTRDITHLIIAGNTDGSYSIHVYGACHPTDCDWNVVPLSLSSNRTASAIYTFSFAVKSLSISMDGSQLRADTFTHFTDGSGRPDYSITDFFNPA
jgi:hypothetical protein